MLACEYDVIALSETWLASDIFDSELFNDRYVVYRRDRDSSFFHTKKYGGGVLLAVSKCLNSCRLTYYESKCEDVWISIDIRVNNKLEKLSICCVYIPSPVQKHVLEHFLDSANQAMETSKLTLILGDFNLGNIEWTGSPGLPLLATLPQNSLYATMLTDFITLNNLDQYNHVKNHNSKILDLVLTNIPVSCLRACDSPLSKVDAHHPPLEFQLSSCTSTLTLSSREEPRYKFYKGDYCKIIEELKVISWHDVFKQCTDVDSMVQLLYDKINNIIIKHIPKSKNSTRKYPCWYSRDLISLLREKNKYPLIHIPACHRKKLDVKAHEVIFVGYSENPGTYIFRDPTNPRKVVLSRDVTFFENCFTGLKQRQTEPEAQSDSVLLFEDARETEPEDCQFFDCDESTDPVADPSSSINRDSVEDSVTVEERQPRLPSVDEEPASLEEESLQERRYPSRNRKPPDFLTYNVSTVDSSEPTTYYEATHADDADKWHHAMANEYNSLIKLHTWDLVDRPNKKVIPCKWSSKVLIKSKELTMTRHSRQ
ncbi:hypothetical protein ABMA27_010070 [Loxostege sticticalis]|uniref:Reverse transcriptase n=1 Tax=Loxostege sticticalis TaxID=481309 RepID=A0ABR3H4L3_LOXSC